MNLNEIKNNKIIRKDIISKTLIKLTSNIKDINFKWINFDYFKKIQNEVFITETGLCHFNSIKNILDTINDIEKEDVNDEENEQVSNDADEEELFGILEEDGNITDDNSEFDEKNTFDLCGLLEDKDRKNKLLLDRLLKKDNLDDYSEIINKIKKKKTKSYD